MRVVLLMVGLGVFFLLGWLLFGQGIEEVWDLDAMVAWFESAKGWAWLVGILLLVGDLLLPIPGTVVMSALGAVYGAFLGGVIASVGALLAGLAGYGIGKFFTEENARKWLGEKDFLKGKELFERRGGWAVAMSRAVPILPEVLACMAGLLRMPFPKFAFALACGSVPMGFLFAWIGSIGRADPAWALGFSILVPALLWLLAILLKRMQ
ncbi:TVP38/TMEM64 family protein [Luteolibacter sp. AS25]|uniref:TVP38/TMEM64 family protein n=1 Tax=Luteolibacter sp. AS25 TaxID=3135776 RepID=UPI00398AAE43